MKLGRSASCAALLLCLVGCRPGATPPPAPEAVESPSPDRVVLEGDTLALAGLGIETALAEDAAPLLRLTGTLEADPAAVALVTARVVGRVIRLDPNVGDSVATGEIVAVVESERLHEAQLAHAQAVKRLDTARNELARRRRLAELGAYGAPGFEDARRLQADAAAEAVRADSELSAAEAALREARDRVVAADAVLEQSRAAAKAATATLDLAERQAGRSERLLAEQLVARREHEEVLANRDKAKADVDASRATIRVNEARKREAEGAVEGAVARVSAAKAGRTNAARRTELAEANFRRGDAIHRGDYLTRKEVAEAEAEVAQARLAADGALDDVVLLGGKPGDNHSIPIRAPFAGRVIERKATLGQTVLEGEPLLRIVDPSHLVAAVAAFPEDLREVSPGRPVRLDIGGDSVQGTVERLSDTADETTRAVMVRVRVPNPAGRHRAGEPVVAEIRGARISSVRVPAGAVQDMAGRSVVFVPGEKEGTFLVRTVRAGTTSEGRTRILSGLQPGERFVARNAYLVKAWMARETVDSE